MQKRSHLVAARALGYLLLYPVKRQDHSVLDSKIASYKDMPDVHDALCELRGLYIT